MDKQKLTELDTQVESAKSILKKIEKLEYVIKCCGSEVGFMDIRVMYHNEGDTSMVNVLGAKETHEAFRQSVKAGALALKEELEAQFKALEIK